MLTPDDFARIQGDTVSLQAQALLPLLVQHARPESAAGKQALDMLQRVGRRRQRGKQRGCGDLRGVVSAADAKPSPATSSDPSRRKRPTPADSVS